MELSGNIALVADSVLATAISVENASIWYSTPSGHLFDATPDILGNLFLFTGTAVSGPMEPALSRVSSLTIGDLALPGQGGWQFCVSDVGCSETIFGEVRSLFVTVPGDGNYSITGQRLEEERGFIGPTNDSISFEVTSSSSFFPNGIFKPIPATPLIIPEMTWPPLEEEEVAVEWKPVRYVLLATAGGAGAVLVVSQLREVVGVFLDAILDQEAVIAA
jgi:hypothetical protein